MTKGAFAIVDAEDADCILPFKWTLNTRGYATRPRRADEDPGPQKIRMHRVILNAPEGIEVDHVNGNQLDNRKVNLRLATHAQNGANSRLLITSNTSGYRGVSRFRARWKAAITVRGRVMYLGLFDDPIVAARVRDEVARLHHGAFARLNFPDEHH